MLKFVMISYFLSSIKLFTKVLVIRDFKISQYAIQDGTERSLNQTLEELSRFSKISGLDINFDVTQRLWTGSEKFNTRSIKTKWKLS